MCYESEGLLRKLRAFEHLRKKRAEAARRVAKQPDPPEKPAPVSVPAREAKEPAVTV